MAATRKLVRIVIRVDTTTGKALDVEALTEMSLTENALIMSGHKVYAKGYDDMGAVAKARVDSFVADVNTFIQNQEPQV